MYSITSRSSFEEVSTFHQQILRVKDKDYFPVVVVANKCDLEYERQVQPHGQYTTAPSVPKADSQRAETWRSGSTLNVLRLPRSNASMSMRRSSP